MARQAATGSTDRGSPARARAWAELGIVAGVVLALMVLNGLLGLSDNVVLRRLSGIVGVAFIVALALLFSDNRRGINRKTVCVGLAIQFVLAVLLLYTPLKTPLFRAMDHAFTRLTDFGMDGTHFLFGWLVPLHPGLKAGMTIASVIIFLGAVMRMLYYLGVMQVVVRGMAYVMRRLMGVSGAESLGTAANVFVGMVESALTVRPYVAGMTRSELFTLMTAGMATVAGSVMAAYTGFVKPFLGENAGGHLVTASLISAPAAILIAKIMIPETELPATSGLSAIPSADTGDDAPVNLFDAAVRGALDGLNLAITVLGLMIAFLGLVAALNALVSVATFGHLTFTSLIGYACSPIAVGMGVPLDEAVRAGSLIGQKTVANEFVAYSALQTMMGPEGAPLTPRTTLVMTYALCGFANLGSVAIMIAGIGGIAPNQRPNLARLGLLSIVGGSLAAFMTGCLAGLLG